MSSDVSKDQIVCFWLFVCVFLFVAHMFGVCYVIVDVDKILHMFSTKVDFWL